MEWLSPEPPSQSLDSETNLDDATEFNSQEVLSTALTSQQDQDFVKPGPPHAHVTNAILKQHLQQQHEEAKAHDDRLMTLLQQREATLVSQLEQQRKESEQQRKELMQLMKEQSEVEGASHANKGAFQSNVDDLDRVRAE